MNMKFKKHFILITLPGVVRAYCINEKFLAQFSICRVAVIPGGRDRGPPEAQGADAAGQL
jgi:hypothetical protein